VIPEYLSPVTNHLWQSTIVAGVAAVLALALLVRCSDYANYSERDKQLLLELYLPCRI
jgi:hypothetical protein